MGAIVYAAADGPLLKRYEIDSLPIVVTAVDFTRNWSEIRDELLNLPVLLASAATTAANNQS